jgi:hypothetical protein
MEKKNKGLADNQEGEIILNESGTSVTTDVVEERTGADENPPLIEEAKDSESAEEIGPALRPGNEG